MIRGIRENCEVLRQGEALLERLTDEQYMEVVQPVFDHAMGAHFRHNFDHYDCFLAGHAGGVIDYTARSRNPRVELCRHSALRESQRLRTSLHALQDTPDALYLLTDGGEDRVRTLTTAERELEFLLSHTVHHYAIVAVICRMQGLSVPSEFGVAPSTLRYRTARISGPAINKATGSRTAGTARSGCPNGAPASTIQSNGQADEHHGG